MQLTSCQHSTGAVWADALFASALQRSDNPDAGQVRQATAAAVRAYGGPGCAERVAQEFGDHPENAVMRMRWARAVVSEVFGSAPGLTQQIRAQESSTTSTGPRQPAPVITPNGEMTVKRIRISRSGIRRERLRPEDLPADPRDPDVVRAKALVRAQLTGSSQKNRARGVPARPSAATP